MFATSINLFPPYSEVIAQLVRHATCHHIGLKIEGGLFFEYPLWQIARHAGANLTFTQPIRTRAHGGESAPLVWWAGGGEARLSRLSSRIARCPASKGEEFTRTTVLGGSTKSSRICPQQPQPSRVDAGRWRSAGAMSHRSVVASLRSGAAQSRVGPVIEA